jgi:bifunctional UDP-N-acetylglucosamine pyrophosphorylase/glucosamine-1-phosphate N-acetyltransferase
MQHLDKSFCVLILAAGKGTRMRSKTPKVLQKVLEEPILSYPLTAVLSAGFRNISTVVGFQGEIIESRLAEEYPNVNVVWQREQLGTGHAAKLARESWESFDNVMILPGDTPLITAQTLKTLAERHVANGNACSFLSFEIPDPTGYGRVIRDGLSVRIVEHKDATPEEAKCKEVNSGMYVFNVKALASVIDKIGCQNKQCEYYLPDALPLIAADGGKIDAVRGADASEFLGVNDPKQLAEATAVMRDRIAGGLMSAGVRIIDPKSVWIGPHVKIAEDVEICPDVQIWGNTTIGSGSRIGSYSMLCNATVGEDVKIEGFVRICDSAVENGASVGPFLVLRNNARLCEGSLAGRFVEIKNSTVGEGSKVPHLSYIGDTEIGKKSNIGAGTITCNYDGVNKNRTKIGDHCFIGSDTMLVAPVTLGDEASTAAGSAITEDVPAGALGVGRGRQTNIEGWSARKKSIKGGNK